MTQIKEKTYFELLMVVYIVSGLGRCCDVVNKSKLTKKKGREEEREREREKYVKMSYC